jgi:hypothetical protein
MLANLMGVSYKQRVFLARSNRKSRFIAAAMTQYSLGHLAAGGVPGAENQYSFSSFLQSFYLYDFSPSQFSMYDSF